MIGDANSKDTILTLQGDLLLVLRPGHPERVFTFVHVVFPDHSELHAVMRHGKTKRTDWTIAQPYLDKILPARENPHGAKWELTLKA